MNPCLRHLNRLEFLVTLACTGRCKHCSQGSHTASGTALEAERAAWAVRTLAGQYPIQSVMTFGGEPLLAPDTVCAIHAAAREQGIPYRQLITNEFFTRKQETLDAVTKALAASGVNDVLLSVDAFHQETISLEAVEAFARSAQAVGLPLRTHPAWLVSPQAENLYNQTTREILKTFARLGIPESSGNVIFPEGNALRYLKEYFSDGAVYENPYAEDPTNLRALCVEPDGSVLNGTIYRQDLLERLEAYKPGNM